MRFSVSIRIMSRKSHSDEDLPDRYNGVHRRPIPAANDPERGASLVEYALLVALIAIVCVAAVSLLGSATTSLYSSAANGLTS